MRSVSIVVAGDAFLATGWAQIRKSKILSRCKSVSLQPGECAEIEIPFPWDVP